MTIPTGSYDLSADNGALLVKTFTDGPAAAMGHNLVIEATSWAAQVEIGKTPAASRVSMTADLTSLEVRDGTGGAKPLSAGDKGKILDNAAKALNAKKHPELRFTATDISGTWDAGLVRGGMTINGTTAPLDLTLDQPAPGELRLTGTIVQSDFGIKPYSTMMGALKLKDAVDVEVSIPFE
ncbi:MAG: YceI family protein [Actinobacteria bacterium]|nr:YceI family protein [Actinomycetota bacterium]